METLRWECKEFCRKVATTFSQCESGFKNVTTVLEDKKRRKNDQGFPNKIFLL